MLAISPARIGRCFSTHARTRRFLSGEFRNTIAECHIFWQRMCCSNSGAVTLLCDFSRKIPSGNVFHRLLAIRKSDSKSPSPLASESSKGAAEKSSVPDLPKGARADRRKR